MKIALILIALGFGYKIFTDANKEQGSLKTLGRIIGLVMIVTSIGIGAYKVAATMSCSGMSMCPAKGFMSCPMMKK